MYLDFILHTWLGYPMYSYQHQRYHSPKNTGRTLHKAPLYGFNLYRACTALRKVPALVQHNRHEAAVNYTGAP